MKLQIRDRSTAREALGVADSRQVVEQHVPRLRAVDAAKQLPQVEIPAQRERPNVWWYVLPSNVSVTSLPSVAAFPLMPLSAHVPCVKTPVTSVMAAIIVVS